MFYFLLVSNDTRHEIACNLNIPYGNGDKRKLDVFGTDLPTGKCLLLNFQLIFTTFIHT